MHIFHSYEKKSVHKIIQKNVIRAEKFKPEIKTADKYCEEH